MSFEQGDGRIELIYGPMFSGKSTELLRRMRRYKMTYHKCIVIKYRKDDRYSDDCMSTHDLQMMKAIACEKLSEVKGLMEKYSVIGIDEGQFFPDLTDFCEDLATNHNKIIIVAALDGTFQRKPFNTTDLIPLAESITKLNAVCQICLKDASFSKRLGSETEVEVIGGSDKYIAVCRKCYFISESELHSKIRQPPSDSPLNSPIKLQKLKKVQTLN